MLHEQGGSQALKSTIIIIIQEMRSGSEMGIAMKADLALAFGAEVFYYLICGGRLVGGKSFLNTEELSG